MHAESQPSLFPKNVPWNKGRLTGQKRPLKPKDVWAIRVRLELQHRARASCKSILTRAADIRREAVSKSCRAG